MAPLLPECHVCGAGAQAPHLRWCDHALRPCASCPDSRVCRTLGGCFRAPEDGDDDLRQACEAE